MPNRNAQVLRKGTRCSQVISHRFPVLEHSTASDLVPPDFAAFMHLLNKFNLDLQLWRTAMSAVEQFFRLKTRHLGTD